jgi:DNA modification methylase
VSDRDGKLTPTVGQEEFPLPFDAAAKSTRVKDAVDFQSLITELTGLDVPPHGSAVSAIQNLIAAIGPANVATSHLLASFYGRMNQKMALNRPALTRLYAAAAKQGVTFNYPTKKTIAWAVDSLNGDLLDETMKRAWPGFLKTIGSLDNLNPCVPGETRRRLMLEATNPSKLRKSHARAVMTDVQGSAVGPLVWSLWQSRLLHQYFHLETGSEQYSGDYLRDLQQQEPLLFDRSHALSVKFIGAEELAPHSYNHTRNAIARWLASEYENLNNFGFLAAIIDAESEKSWEIASDIVLFGEHLAEHEIPNMFFRWREVQKETTAYIPGIDPTHAQFNLAQEGFTYRDQFVLADSTGRVKRIVVVAQKNLRDETPIPCPACRSLDIEGNSYPTPGVKSWECRNQLCPDRSIYNRGKRYQFKALLTQAAIENPQNEIPVESVRRWQRDVLTFRNDQDIIATLVRHYSMVGDGIKLYDCSEAIPEEAAAGRKITVEDSKMDESKHGALFDKFIDGPLFKRFGGHVPERSANLRSPVATPVAFPTGWSVVEGDALTVLKQISDNSIDRAITSPPYFNAREYAQWPNLYCYLHDMELIAAEVFRVLKPGAVYAYNIFDYFDNERTLVFSDMGKKRIALSAWTVQVFRRAGFTLAGNLVWDKGEIHGKRGYNAGNFSPFYQSPFNCWEHVLLFHKGDPAGNNTKPFRELIDHCRQIARIQPVRKLYGGENRYGHTAPFPTELPRFLMAGLTAESLVLDPFAGSGTTARAALQANLRSIMIERDPEYCALARQMIHDFESESGEDAQYCLDYSFEEVSIV